MRRAQLGALAAPRFIGVEQGYGERDERRAVGEPTGGQGAGFRVAFGLKTGDVWLHLRICLECGHVGCCDSSIGKHASAHFHETLHPVAESAEPGESWRWCFVHNLTG